MGAIPGTPHPFPYQGSKRQLASAIVGCIPQGTARLVEPFVGSGAVTLATARLRRARRFVLSDIHEPLVQLWRAIIQDPRQLAHDYAKLWREQAGREREFYDRVRAQFNAEHQPHQFLYLLARCVKAAVRYNGRGEFNNSPDNRRLGMHPDSMRRNLEHASGLLRGRAEVTCRDYQEVLAATTSDDVVYMDPPYQGVCDTRDHRYVRGVGFAEFAAALADLNRRRVPFIVSYDGRTGVKVHGQQLPASLLLLRRELRVGRSTQATLLGRDHETVESLYLSPALLQRLPALPDSLAAAAPTLFATA